MGEVKDETDTFPEGLNPVHTGIIRQWVKNRKEGKVQDNLNLCIDAVRYESFGNDHSGRMHLNAQLSKKSAGSGKTLFNKVTEASHGVYHLPMELEFPVIGSGSATCIFQFDDATNKITSIKVYFNNWMLNNAAWMKDP